MALPKELAATFTIMLCKLWFDYTERLEGVKSNTGDDFLHLMPLEEPVGISGPIKIDRQGG